MMRQFNTIRLFINIYMLVFAFGLLFPFFIEKGDIVVFINAIHNPVTDIIFKYITFIGDGLLFLPLIIGLLFVKYLYALMATIIAVFHGLIISFLKKIVFKGSPRPTAYFEDTSMLHFIEGVKVHTSNSFPSGHTATAFALCVFLTFLINRKLWGVILLFLAVLGGYSRIYLLQHFYIDTVVGGLIGTIVTIITWKIFENKSSPNWLNNSIKLSNQ